MIIEVGSKWQHKDGGVYEVVENGQNSYFCGGANRFVCCVWYKDKQGEVYVRTEKHFLQSFKPYEPIYEWQWAFKNKNTCGSTQISLYMTENEFIELQCKQDASFEYQRLDFTKRERK